MKQKFFCAMPNCTTVVQNRDAYRAHIKKVHKNLTPEEVKEWWVKISETQPTYEVSEDQLGEIEEADEKPKKKQKIKKHTNRV